jgi:hypothetical protein
MKVLLILAAFAAFFSGRCVAAEPVKNVLL